MPSPVMFQSKAREAANSAPPSNPRIELAACIERLRLRRERLAGTESALGVAQERVSNARRQVGVAERAIEAGKEAAIQCAIAQARGDAETPAVDIRATHTALALARDDLEIAVSARDALKADLDAPFARYLPEVDVNNAAAQVIAHSAELSRLVEKVTDLQRALVDYGGALDFLASEGAIPFSGNNPNQGYVAEFTPAQQALHRLRSPALTWKALLDDPGVRGSKPWATVLEQLLVDPNAKLPDVR